jgi:tetratricopeptide (TPR) repeat protein
MEAEEVAQSYFEHLRRAQLLMEVSRWREALHEYDQHLSGRVDDYHALCNSAFCYLKLKEYQSAYDRTKRAIEADPEGEWAYRLQSAIFAANGERKRALDAAKLCVQKAPGSPEGFQCLFWAQADCGSLDEAAVTLKSLLEGMPESSASHEAAGYLALKRRKNFEAEKHYLEALKLDPQSVNALNNLGVVYLNLAQAGKGRHYQQKSIELFERAVKTRPTFELGQKNISTASNALKLSAPAGLFFLVWIAIRFLGFFATTGSKAGGETRNAASLSFSQALDPTASSYLVTAANFYFLFLLIAIIAVLVICLKPRYRANILYHFTNVRGWLIASLLFGGAVAFFIFAFRFTSTPVDTTPPFSGAAFMISLVLLIFTGSNLFRFWQRKRAV